MGRWLYTIKDRKTGTVLFCGGESACARFLDCEPAYMTSLVRRNAEIQKETVFGNIVVIRQWTESRVQCQQCGVTLEGVNPNTKFCQICVRLRKKLRKRGGIALHDLQMVDVEMYIQEDQREMQERCHGCRFFGGGVYPTCNYIFIMDHSRGCPPGAECTKREER